jgi:hypothetical protein
MKGREERVIASELKPEISTGQEEVKQRPSPFFFEEEEEEIEVIVDKGKKVLVTFTIVAMVTRCCHSNRSLWKPHE